MDDWKRKTFYAVYDYLVLPLMIGFGFVYSLFSAKVKEGFSARVRFFSDLEKKLNTVGKEGDWVWIHASSAGEFESIKPVIMKMREEYAGLKIIATIFSPSGYRNALKFKNIDVLMYLPFDSRNSMEKFISAINPKVILVARYDLWPNMGRVAKEKNVPLIIVNAVLSEQSKRRRPLSRGISRIVTSNATEIWAVSHDDAERFRTELRYGAGISVLGDSRFEQVYNKIANLPEDETLFFGQELLKDKKVVIAGSTWKGDEKCVLGDWRKIYENFKDAVLLLVPHEPAEKHVEKLQFAIIKQGLSFCLFSELTKENPYRGEQVLIVDKVGVLAKLYSLGDIAYVGGGFGYGVHNVIEPMVFGMPVVFGPRHLNSYEAKVMKAEGTGFAVSDSREFYGKVIELLGGEFSDVLRKKSAEILKNNLSVSDRVCGELGKFFN